MPSSIASEDGRLRTDLSVRKRTERESVFRMVTTGLGCSRSQWLLRVAIGPRYKGETMARDSRG